ncbi:hypothetical protein FNV43_RR07770 [Rhamnella rubrinervis]|uniref:Ubiquitin-like domain-containing protein n=1 Tax=Rhamnella rubrinervis TaxID=2594499 RepID=A0A8K0HGC9_9ROSA|nr:hypothetical protein FNV43_RR07770 [Rhamnella rubrinervis]
MDSPSQEPKVIEVTIDWIGAPCSYKIKTSATVRELKKMIKDEFIIGIPVKKQDLEYNGEWLQDEAKLEDYGIDTDVDINLVRKIDLWIVKDKDEMSTYLMLVNETITVAKLKEIIAEQFGESNISWLRDNRNDIPLEDHMTLSHYGITENSEVKYFSD